MPQYTKLRTSLATELRRDASAHREGRFRDIGSGYWELDAAAWECRPADDPLLIAHSFWDGWQDARNHDWRYYPGIDQHDWPVLADSLALALDEGREIENPTLIDNFVLRRSDGVLSRLKNWFGLRHGE